MTHTCRAAAIVFVCRRVSPMLDSSTLSDPNRLHRRSALRLLETLLYRYHASIVAYSLMSLCYWYAVTSTASQRAKLELDGSR